MANKAKKSQVDLLSEVLSAHPHFALVKFERTTHQSLEALRRELKKADSAFKVIKNTLFEKTLNKLSQKEKSLNEFRKSAFPLKEYSALLTLGEDYIQGLSAFYKHTKDLEGLAFKWGFLDGAVYDMQKLESLAKLPPKVELQAKVIGLLRGPSQKLVSSLTFNVSKLVYVLQERGKQAS